MIWPLSRAIRCMSVVFITLFVWQVVVVNWRVILRVTTHLVMLKKQGVANGSRRYSKVEEDRGNLIISAKSACAVLLKSAYGSQSYLLWKLSIPHTLWLGYIWVVTLYLLEISLFWILHFKASVLHHNYWVIQTDIDIDINGIVSIGCVGGIWMGAESGCPIIL